MDNKIDWIIHFVVNDVACDCCGKVENPFPEFMCNAHTHGMEELYNHPDFQIVLQMDPNLLGYILNELGARVQNGAKFKAGDEIADIIANGYVVRLVEAKECGRTVLRVLLPDVNNHFPGDADCEYPYNQQADFNTEI